MWLNLWTVTIALAIGFAVMAQAVQRKDDEGTRVGRSW